MNPTDIKAKKPPKIQARQTANRIILQSNAITEILENKIRLISKVSDVVISFFKAKANHPLFMDYFYEPIWN